MVVDTCVTSNNMIWQLVDSSQIGGIESHIATLTRTLNEAGTSTKIILLKKHGNNPWLEQLDRLGLSWQALGGGFISLIKAIQRERPTLIHTHGYKAGILGRVAARLLGVPVVSTFHAGERGAFPVSLYQKLDELSACLGSSIAVNEGIARNIPYKATVIGNFILPSSDTALTLKPLSVAFVGRLSHEKAPDLFCEMAAQVDPSIPFDVFGDGLMRAELEAKYAPHVTFHGLAKDMGQVWPQIGLLVMPSRAEGLPMAALEALAEGIPVLATHVGAFSQIIVQGKTGWVSSIEDMPAQIMAWAKLSAEQRLAMAADCKADVMNRYGAQQAIEQILAVYEVVYANNYTRRWF